MGHCHFMAWHTLQDALKMTGRSRSQFYRDMRAGLVSYRTGQDGRREFETSELIRAYGELKQDETAERHSAGQAENPHDQQTERILRELNERTNRHRIRNAGARKPNGNSYIKR